MTKPRGYFEFDSNGETIKGVFGTGCAVKFMEKWNLKTLDEFYELLGSGNLKALASILFCAVEYMCELEDREFGYKEIQAYGWMDHLTIEGLLKMIKDASTAPDEGSKKKAKARR